MVMDQLTQIIIIGLLVVFLIFTYVFKRPSGSPKVNATTGILSDIGDNIKILEDRITNPQKKTKFETANWQKYKGKLGFLDDSEIDTLVDTFSMISDFNARAHSSRGNKALSSVDDVGLEKLREPLNKSKAVVSDWLRAHYQEEMQKHKKNGGYFSNQ
jgi:hypothetical protein